MRCFCILKPEMLDWILVFKDLTDVERLKGFGFGIS